MMRIKTLRHLVKLLDLVNKSNTQIVIGGKKHSVIDMNSIPKSSKSQPLLDLLVREPK